MQIIAAAVDLLIYRHSVSLFWNVSSMRPYNYSSFVKQFIQYFELTDLVSGWLLLAPPPVTPKCLR
jgi:hypothetical protein